MPINKPYRDLSALPAMLPVFPLTGVLLLPAAQLPLNIFEPRYLRMFDDALTSHRLIGMIQPADPADSLQGKPPLRRVGCAGRITQFAESGDGRYVLTLTGVARFRIIDEAATTTPYRMCNVDFSEFDQDLSIPASDISIDRQAFVRTLQSFSEARNLRIDEKEIERASDDALVNAIAVMGPFGPEEKQALLEAPSILSRSEALIAIMEIDLARRAGGSGKLQ